MCLRTTKLQYQIAKEDILVYKVLLPHIANVLVSPYQSFKYELNTLYQAKLCGDVEYLRHDNFNNLESLFSSENLGNFFYYVSDYAVYTTVNISTGLHTHRTILDAQRTQNFLLSQKRNAEIFEAIIPKGSIYFENDEDYASNQLIVIRQI